MIWRSIRNKINPDIKIKDYDKFIFTCEYNNLISFAINKC